MEVQDLQQHLSQVYEIDLRHDVADFLTSDRTLGEAIHPRTAREKLLLAQDGDDLHISLYLADEVLDSLRNRDPRACLDRRCLTHFLEALEGVSHFAYVVWNAQFDKPISLLELELQAEIDKYITGAVFSGTRSRSRAARFRRMLFARPRFREELDRNERHRYRQANDYANRFCQDLEERYRYDFGGRRMFNELRRFYRLPGTAKLRSIGVPACSLSLS